MFYPIGFSHNWLLYIGVPLIIGLWAQIRVSSAFSKWSKVRASSNITGAETAREILRAARIDDVDVVETNDFLGDHYDPTSKRLCISSNVYNTLQWLHSVSPRTNPATPFNTPSPTHR